MRTIAARIVIAMATAPLLAAAQVFDWFGPVALMAMVPWFWVARSSGAVQAIATGALVGTLYGCLSATWIPEALRGLGASGGNAVVGLVLSAAWAKLPLFSLAGLTVTTLSRLAPSVQIAGIALAFGFGEWWIAGSSLGIPVALIGHSQRGLLGVAQLALLGGVPLLSAWLVAINQSIVLGIGGSQTARRITLSLVAAWVAMVLGGLPLAKAARQVPQGGRPISLLVIQPDLPRGERWVAGMQRHNLERVTSFTDQVLASLDTRVDAVIWPENLLTSPIDTNLRLSQAVQKSVDRWDTPLITGMVRSADGSTPRRYRSSILWIAPQRGVVHAVDKERAIPLVESSRNLVGFRTVERLFGRAAQWPRVVEAHDVGALRASFEIVPALCYEALFPDLVAQRRGPESVAILNLADDSWVSGETLTRQLVDIAAFRAIEQRLTLIRVAHGGLSAVISPFGERVAELPLDSYAYKVVSVSPGPPASLAERASIAALPLLIGFAVYWLSGFIVTTRDERDPEG